MSNVANTGEDLCAIYVDMGTTNTRVWLMRGNEVLARDSRPVGVRDSAPDGSTAQVRGALKELIANVLSKTNGVSDSNLPVCVAAAGMISSPLGLAELPHLPTPAGPRELFAGTRRFEFPDICGLPFLLVPGVRSGPAASGLQSPGQIDVMRGEETLCAGLHALGMVDPPAVVLTLGSHWKAIQLAADGRVQASVTSLSGEMIHAVRTRTILASSVGNDWPNKLAPKWLEAGMEEQRRSGLPRALFCVRLLEINDQGTPEDRFAYLIGAFIATDLDALFARGVLAGDPRVVISGATAIAETWAVAFARLSMKASVLTDGETEKAFLAGLKRIVVEQILIEAISRGESNKNSAVNQESNWRTTSDRKTGS